MSQLLSLNKASGGQLKKSKVGIIGMGRLGQQISIMLLGFRPDIFYYDIKEKIDFLEPSLEPILDRVDSIGKLFEICDNVLILATQQEDGSPIVTKEHIDCIDDDRGVLLINVSRGSNLCPDALMYGLNNEKLVGASLDVTDSYSDGVLERFKKYRQLWLSGHIAGKSVASRMATDDYVFKKLAIWAVKKGFVRDVTARELMEEEQNIREMRINNNDLN